MSRPLLLAITLTLVAACASERGDSPAGATPSGGGPFEYVISFVPRDSIYGESGFVRGEGGSWSFGPSASFVIELPTTPVSGTPFGGTALVVVLSAYTTTANGLPQPGQYSIGPVSPDHAGRGWLRDPSRVWATNSDGFLLIEAWDGDDVTGTFALRLEQEIQVEAGPTPTGLFATVSGTFVARRVR